MLNGKKEAYIQYNYKSEKEKQTKGNIKIQTKNGYF